MEVWTLNHPVRRITVHGMALIVFYWFGICTYIAFMVTTLMDHGWSDSAAAGAMTAMSVIILLVQPVYGYISDKFFSEKKLTVILLAVSAVCFLLLPLSLRSGSMVLVVMNMIGVTATGMQIAGLLDAWIVGLKQEYPSINYGLMRGCGSLSFALSAQIMGAVTVGSGHDVRLWLGGGAILLSVFLALTFRSTRSGCREKPEHQLTGIEAFKLIFSSKQYNLLLGVSFFLLLSGATMLTLIQLLVRDFGGTTAQIGTATAIMAGSEVPFMFLTAYILNRVGFKKLLVFCGAVYVIRLFITASVATVEGLLYVQLLQGLTFAVLLPISMSYLAQILDTRIRATAVTIYSAATMSLAGILGNLTTSALLASGFSVQTALIVFAFSALIGLSLTLYGVVRKIW